MTKETYEKIRVPAKWEQILSRLELFREKRRAWGKAGPRLRIIFTWMKSNRPELALLPEFAQTWGASEIDVRYVSPTVGVDVSAEVLNGEDPRTLNAELAAAARDAVARGLAFLPTRISRPPRRCRRAFPPGSRDACGESAPGSTGSISFATRSARGSTGALIPTTTS
jgi:hypothetical protein